MVDFEVMYQAYASAKIPIFHVSRAVARRLGQK